MKTINFNDIATISIYTPQLNEIIIFNREIYELEEKLITNGVVTIEDAQKCHTETVYSYNYVLRFAIKNGLLPK